MRLLLLLLLASAGAAGRKKRRARHETGPDLAGFNEQALAWVEADPDGAQSRMDALCGDPCRVAFAAAYNNAGSALVARGNPRLAAHMFFRALELDAALPQAHINLANILVDVDQLNMAAEHFEAALDNLDDPEHRETTVARLLHVSQRVVRWRRLERLEREAVADVRRALAAGAVPALLPLHAQTLPGLRPAELTALGLAHAGAAAAPRPASELEAAAGRVLRVAYVSADFKAHPIGDIMAGLLPLLDRRRVHVTTVSLVPPEARDARSREIAAASDVAAATAAVPEDTDVLVDLNGLFTRYARPELLAARAAPVQVSYLGYLHSTGSPAVDYAILDAAVLPPTAAGAWTEGVAYVPPSFLAPSPRSERAPAPPAHVRANTRAAHGLPRDAPVLASFGQHLKITPRALDAWCGALRRLPGAVLLLLQFPHDSEPHLRAQLAARGVSPRRLVVLPKLARGEHVLAEATLADVVLDTVGYNGGATGIDVAWAGLPSVGLPTETVLGRMCLSLQPGLAAASMQDYEDVAVALARALPRPAPRFDVQRAADAHVRALRAMAEVVGAVGSSWSVSVVSGG